MPYRGGGIDIVKGQGSERGWHGTVLVAASAVCLCIWPALAGPLHEAARKGEVQSVVRLLDNGSGVDERDETGETALFAATLAKKPDVVVLLLTRKADINARNNRGMTPLHAAAYSGQAEETHRRAGR